MIEDFIEDPRAELRWLLIAWLMLVAAVYCVWLTANAGVALTAAATGGNDLAPGFFLATIVKTADFQVLRALIDPIVGIFTVIAIFVARNFLRAFEAHRSRVLCAVALTPMLFVGALPSGDAIAGAGLALAGLIWVRLLPLPRQDGTMSPILRGAAVGFTCGVFIFFFAGVIAALWAGRLLARGQGVQAAAVGIAAAVPAIPVALSLLVNGGPSLDNVVFTLILLALLVEAVLGIAQDTVSPPPADEPDREGRPGDVGE